MRIYSGAPNIQSQMQLTTAALNRALTRLSAGQRVSSPKDDVASFAIGQKLETQVRGLTQEIRNNQAEISESQKKESTLMSQLDVVQRMREIAVQASSENVSANDRDDLNSELKTLLDQYFGLSSETSGFKKIVGNGQFDARATVFQSSGTMDQMEAVDINEDGYVDILTMASTISDTIYVRLGTASGAFTPAKTFITGTGAINNDFRLGDMNGDGHLDLVVSSTAGSNVSVSLGDGAGNFENLFTDSSTSTGITRLADVDGDGNLDYVYTDSTDIFYSAGDGAGNLSGSATSIYVTSANSILDFDFGDANNDGRPDLYAYEFFVGNVSVAGVNINVGDAVFVGGTQLGGATSTGGAGVMELADMNGDQITDIVVGTSEASYVTTFLGSADGSFAFASTIDTGNPVSIIGDIEIGDLDGDGNLDVVVQSNAVGYSGVAYGRGNGTYDAYRVITDIRGSTDSVELVDLDRDGAMDIMFRQFLLKGRTREISALADVDVSSVDKAQDLLKILDQTLDSLSRQIGDLGALHSKLDYRSASQVLMAETLDDARSRTVDADLALETAEVLRLQILQEAQTAVLAQGNLSLQMVLKLIA